MKKRIYILVGSLAVTVLLAIGIANTFYREEYDFLITGLKKELHKEFVEYKRYESPDGQYVLVVYMEKDPFIFPITHSEADYVSAYVTLEDTHRKILARPSFFRKCRFMLGDLYVDWLPDKTKVYYTKFDYIDLKKLKVRCQ